MTDKPTLPVVTDAAATYINLFAEDWEKKCLSDSLEVNTGPLAYLTELNDLSTRVEALADPSDAITLDMRRPDLRGLAMDAASLTQPVAAIRLATDQLETCASEALADQPLRDVMADATWPVTLPFNASWETTKTTLKTRQLPLWDMLRITDFEYPNFVFGNLCSSALRSALMLATGFAPTLRTLLTAPTLTTRTELAGIGYRFAPDQPDSELGVLDGLRRNLGLNRKQVRQLLAVNGINAEGTAESHSSVRRSGMLASSQDAATSATYGASFINGGGAPLYLLRNGTEKTNGVLVADITPQHIDRMIRVLRLAHGLSLPYASVDLLLNAALTAEGSPTPHQITEATIRAIGLFQHLRDTHGVTAEQFAGFISCVPAYTVEDGIPFLDTLFRTREGTDRTGVQQGFLLDDGEISPDFSAIDDMSWVAFLAEALNVDVPMAQGLLRLAAEAHAALPSTNEPVTDTPAIRRSLSFVSACYRMLALPRLLGLDAAQGLALIMLLGSEHPALLRQLAGRPSLSRTPASAEPDIVDAIVGVMNAAAWIKRQRMGKNLLTVLTPQQPSPPRDRWARAVERAGNSELYKTGATAEDKASAVIMAGLPLTDIAYALPLMAWAGITAAGFNASVAAINDAKVKGNLPCTECFEPGDIALWHGLERRMALLEAFRLAPTTLLAIVGSPTWFNLEGADDGSLRPFDLTTAYQLSRYADFLATLPDGMDEADVLGYFGNVSKKGYQNATQAAGRLASLIGWTTEDVALLAASIAPKTQSAVAEDMRDIDYILRMSALSARSGLSAESLLAFNRLKDTPTHEDFARSARDIMTGCDDATAMEVAGIHAEAWRDALVARAISDWVPRNPARWPVVNAADLSNYLLMDLKVGREPTTSLVASAITSFQTFLHRVFSGLEPGYRSANLPAEWKHQWEDYGSQYSRWRLIRGLRNHPENHIDPTRRKKKTAAFQDLENLLGQGVLSDEDIKIAILGYLTSFEKTCNIQPLTAYADGTDPATDTYHFIGKSNDEPAQYFWRTVDFSIRDDAAMPSMLAWGEWEPIKLAFSGAMGISVLPAKTEDTRTRIDAIRPVVIAGRRYAIWAEWDGNALKDDKGQPTPYYGLNVCYSYQQTDGLWSPSNVLMRLDGSNDGLASGGSTTPRKERSFDFGLIAMVNIEGVRKNDPWLTVLLYDNAPAARKKTEKKNDTFFMATRDLLLVEERGLATDDLEQAFARRLITVFGDARVVQHPYRGVVRVAECSPPPSGRPVNMPMPPALQKKFGNGPAGVALLEAKLSDDFTSLHVTANFSGVWEQQKSSQDESVLIATTPGGTEYRLRAELLEVGLANEAIPQSYKFHKVRFTLEGPTGRMLFVFARSGSDPGYPDRITLDSRTKPTVIVTFEAREGGPVIPIEAYSRETGLRAKIAYAGEVKEQPFTWRPFLNTAVTTDNAPFGEARLVLKGPVRDAMDLSSEDHAVIETLGLTPLLTFAEANVQGFAKLSEQLFVEPTYELRSVVLNAPLTFFQKIFSPFGLYNPLAGHTTRVTTVTLGKLFRDIASEGLNSKSRKNYLKADAARLTATSGALMPKDVRIEDVLLLKYDHPATFNRFMLASKRKDGVILQVPATMDGRNGGHTIHFDYPLDPQPGSYTFTLQALNGDVEVGACSVTCLIKDLPEDIVPSSCIVRNAHQVMYLDLTEVNAKLPEGERLFRDSIRLNTLFGKTLVALAVESIERVLSREAQRLPEPRMAPGSPTEMLDFRGANGLIFWELFFHLPFLVAWQLLQTRQYREAWQWCSDHLFDPHHSPGGDVSAALSFWRSTPLTWGEPLLQLGVERSTVEELAYEQPERYQKAVFLFLVDYWRRKGDDLYRQLNRDSLAEAARCYGNALGLIGPLPERLTATPIALPVLRDAIAGMFLPPVNVGLVERRDLLQNRLDNLRHGLTIDGKVATISLYGEADEPDLVGNPRTGKISGQATRRMLRIPQHRFREILPRAVKAVDQLVDMGRRVMHNYEQEYDASLGVMQQGNLIKLADFTTALQRESVAAARAERNTLAATRAVTQQRRENYQGLYEAGRSDLEILGSVSSMVIPATALMAGLFEYVAGAVKPVPRIVGTSVGGGDPSGPPEATATNLKLAIDTLKDVRDEIRQQADYQRRSAGWLFEARQAEGDLVVIDRQIDESVVRIRAAEIAQAEEQARQAVMAEEYVFMTTGFAIAPTYVWMIARLSDIYAHAYDATIALCLAAEAAYQFETGKFDSRFVNPGAAWLDGWKGMLAGESLQSDLAALDAAFITGNQRFIQISKVVSLTKTLGCTLAELTSDLDRKGSIAFSLPAPLYDADFPGHYLRRILNVSVALVVEAPAGSRTTHVAGVLTQTSSKLIYTESRDAASSLYPNADATSGTPEGIRLDLRPNQQVALCTIEPAAGANSATVLAHLTFNDGRYLPFEGTGAISTWLLEFPGDDDAWKPALKEGDTWLLKDIVVTVDYTAANGSPDFAGHVRSLRQPPVPGDRNSPATNNLPAKTTETLKKSNVPYPLPRLDIGVTITAVVPGDSRLSQADQVTFSWNGPDASCTWQSKPLQGDPNGTSFHVPDEVASASAGKSVVISYVVHRTGGTVQSSPVTVAIGDLQGLALTSPDVLESSPQRALDLRDAAKGATVRIKPWPFIQEGQKLWTHCSATNPAGKKLEVAYDAPVITVGKADVTGGVTIMLPADWLVQLPDYADLKIEVSVGLNGGALKEQGRPFPPLVLAIPRRGEATLLSSGAATVAKHTSINNPARPEYFAYVVLDRTQGPTELSTKKFAGTEEKRSVIVIPVEDAKGTKREIKLRATRSMGAYARGRLEDPAPWGDAARNSTFLNVTFDPKDNSGWNPGQYKGMFVIQEVGATSGKVQESIRINIDITR